MSFVEAEVDYAKNDWVKESLADDEDELSQKIHVLLKKNKFSFIRFVTITSCRNWQYAIKLEKTSTTFGYIDNYREKYKEMTNVKKKITKVVWLIKIYPHDVIICHWSNYWTCLIPRMEIDPLMSLQCAIGIKVCPFSNFYKCSMFQSSLWRISI